MHHRDPVCFRAAIFCGILADWAKRFEVVVDVNTSARRSKIDAKLAMILAYSTARELRALEAMCITQFLYGAHDVLLAHTRQTRFAAVQRYKEDHPDAHWHRWYQAAEQQPK